MTDLREQIHALREQLAELTAAKDAEIAKLHGDVGRAKDALGIVKAKVPQVSQHRLRNRLREAEATIARVKALHQPVPCCNSRHDGGEGQHCGVCEYDDPNGNIWPCPTIRALTQPNDQPKGT